MDNKIRIQKFISEAGICSRRAAEKLLVAGEVTVNGQVVTELGTKIDPSSDSVVVSGSKIRGSEKVLYAFHKPRGLITTLDDPQGRACVGDYIESLPYSKFRIVSGKLFTFCF